MIEDALSVTPVTPAGEVTVVAASLGELVEAHPGQPGRVASSRVLKADGVRLVHLAFDDGQQLTEHTAPVPILLQCVTGRFTIEVAERRIELAPGGIVHLTRRLPHAVTAHGESRLLITLLDSADWD